MPPKKGPPTPNKPPENPNWTLDEGEEMRRDINDLQKKTVTKDELQEMRDSMEANMHSMEAKLMDSMEAKLDTKMDSMEDKLDTKMDSMELRWIQWKLRSWK
jgi:L-lactate utilization protein LutC